MAYPAEAFMKNVLLEIGGQKVDYVDSAWAAIRRELYLNSDERESYFEMNNFRVDDPIGLTKTFYVKVPFYFTEGDVTKALPLIALQYHEVKLNYNFNSALTGCAFVSQRVYADYIFLDTQERTLFAQNPHEYLITQLQIQDVGFQMTPASQNLKVQLNFNHPVRCLVWAGTTNVHGAFSASQKSLEANDSYAPVESALLQINGQDRFTTRPGSYFRFVQPLTTFGRSPSAGIYAYSFGLQSIGRNASTLNFSRIDMATLLLKTKSATAASIANVVDETQTTVSAIGAFTSLKIFAVNYNVGRVMSGMFGVAYAN
jgi:hypothetical protein